MIWDVEFTKQSVKDLKKLKSSNLIGFAKTLLNTIRQNPFQNPPPYEKLSGGNKNYYSRRINRQHRLVYEVLKEEKVIKILRMWTHYE